MLVTLTPNWKEIERRSAIAKEHKLKYHTILDISNANFESVLRQIKHHDVIVWESRYVYDISRKLEGLMGDINIPRKILIECYISEPRWWYKPKGVHHDIYILNSHSIEEGIEGMDDWKFYNLKYDEKAIWDKAENEL